jgi:HK97 family phage major capsid protein
MGVTDTLGRSILQADATGRPFNSLYGAPIVLSTYAPIVAAGNSSILFGDLAASYTLRTVNQGLTIVRLTERYAELNQTGFIGRTRAGGYLTTQSASPSLVSLKQHA